MWFIRKKLPIAWRDRVSNNSVLTRIGMTRKLSKVIKSRKTQFWGHGMQCERMKNLVVTGITVTG